MSRRSCNNLLAPKELADAMLSALADDGALLDDASPELKRLRSRLRDERVELEARLLRSLNSSGMESFVSDYIVTVRNRRFVLPMKLNYSERFEGIVQDRSGVRRNAVRRADVGGRSEQPPDDARARGRGRRDAHPGAADRDGARLRARVADDVRRDGRARRAQRARDFRRALPMRRAGDRRRGHRFDRRAPSAADDQRPRRDSDRRENRAPASAASSSPVPTPAAKPSRSRPSACSR